MTTPKEEYWTIRLASAQEALQKNGFAASILPSAKEAARFVAEEILPLTEATLVGFGGSVTVVQSGLLDLIRAKSGITLLDTTDRSLSREQIIELRRQALLSDLFLSSSNAVTMDGKLLNLDMIGNRVGAMHFGPRKVALLVGRNKLCEDIDHARIRVKELASPMNTMRIGSKTPCVKTGRCSDCKSPERICNVWTVTEKCFPPQRIHVLLINEEAGF